MTPQFKSPDKLEFNSDNAPESVLPEKLYLEKEQLTAIELEKLKSNKQDRKERKKYASHIFTFIWVWCLVILLMMIGVGFGLLKFETSVIITLISTTPANILALFVIVANYLFFRPKN